MTNKPTPEGASESGSRPSLDDAPRLTPPTLADTTDRQNLADTLTVPLPPENRAGPRKPLDLMPLSPASMDRTPITDRYEGALDLMGIPASESVLVTPDSTEARSGHDDAWFVRTGQPTPMRGGAPSEGSIPAPIARKSSNMPVLVAGTVGVLLVMFVIGYLLFG